MRRVVIATLTMLLLGIVAGLVWVWLAHPAQWEAREGGLVLTEAASRGQFSAIVTFVVIGLVTSLLWGWAVTWALPDLGWLLVPFVLVLSVLAALVAWRVGVELGPPPPGSVPGVAVGDQVPAQLEIDGIAPFLIWPIFGLVGMIGSAWTASGRSEPSRPA